VLPAAVLTRARRRTYCAWARTQRAPLLAVLTRAIATKAAASPVRAARGGAGDAGADAAADSPARASNAMPEVTRPVVDKTECLDRLEGIKTTVGPIEHTTLKDMIIHATSNSKPLKAFTSAKHDELGVKYAVMLSHNEKKRTVAGIMALGCLLCGNAEQMQEYSTNKGIAAMCTAEHKVTANSCTKDVCNTRARGPPHSGPQTRLKLDAAGQNPTNPRPAMVRRDARLAVETLRTCTQMCCQIHATNTTDTAQACHLPVF
jgi:hypothetical protein